MKKMNSFQLKIIALILMLMDHLYFAFSNIFPLWFHPLSRVVAPIFAFLMIEGFYHTRSRLNYNIRLFGWAIFMEAGNRILNLALESKGVSVHNNIFMTLFIGLTIINLIEYSKGKDSTKKLLLILGAIILIPLSMFTEGGIVIIPFILITYFFRGNLKNQIIGYIILFIPLAFSAIQIYPGDINLTIMQIMFNSDFLFILVVPFILLYNGERGLNNKFSKYLFYVFYPLHLWILAITEFILK